MKRLFIYVILTALCATACSDLTLMNVNPTKANKTVDPGLLIPTIQASHSLGRENWSRFRVFPGAWTNHWSGVWSVVEYGGKGKSNNQYNYRLWQSLLYPEAVKNLVALEQIVDNDPEMVNYSAIAKVLRVEVFLKLTDYYGDVPYFEGGQGYYGQIYAPKYDKQEDIYMDFFKRLDDALEQFDVTKKTPESDCYFKGNVEQWKRFAASLKLRIAMRLIKVKPEFAEKFAEEAFKAGVMESNEDIVAVKHGLEYEVLGAGNGAADNMLQITGNQGLGLTQFKISTEFFNALTIRDPKIYEEPPYHRLLAKDPRLLLIAKSYFSPSGAGLPAWADGVDVTELVRKYNSGNTGSQSPKKTNEVDGYLNVDGYMTVPAQEFMYGGGIQRTGENGYTGEDKVRSVWGPAITPKDVAKATWMSEDERNELSEIVARKADGMVHGHYRLGPSRIILAVDSPYIHMTFAETQFLLAESTIRGWNIDTESAEERFRIGYKAAVKQFSIYGVSDKDMPSDAEIDSYLEQWLLPEIRKGGVAALEEINKQIWILHFMDPFEAWANIRRTDGMPSAFVKFYNRYPAENQSDGKAPKRIPYPIDEQTKNRANWQEAVDRMGGEDLWTVPVWWDVQK